LTDDFQIRLQSAIDEHRRGDVAAASAKYGELVAARPEHWDAVYLHGTALLQLGRLQEAIDVFERVAAARPDVPDLHNNLGVAYQALGNWEMAARAFQTAIKLRADYDPAFFNLGRLMEGRQLWADAEKCFRHAVELKPADANYRLRLADSLGQQNKWEEAEQVVRQGLDLDAKHLDLRVILGFVLVKQNRLDEAAAVYRGVLETKPDYAEVHSNLAFVLESLGFLEEALAEAERAIELRADYADGFNNLGTVLRSLHRLDDACRAFRTAIERKPDFALAEFNLGTTLLLAEKYAEGWTGYRRHSRVAGTIPPGPEAIEWDGRAIPGKRLLVYADQGFGDAIQFARFLKRCKEQSQATVVFRCQPTLMRLFVGLRGVDELVAENQAADESQFERKFDFHVPLANLPVLFDVTVESAGDGVPYLSLPNEMRPELAEMLRPRPERALRVGLVWQGNPLQTRDALRSVSLEKLLPLLEVPETAFYSLQTEEPGLAQIRALSLGERLIDVGRELTDFADTATVLGQLDLVITVDTATAHLAGALGRPVWTMLGHTPDWRWHLVRTDSRWYPTMRLFRPHRRGDWDWVVLEVIRSLSEAVRLRQASN